MLGMDPLYMANEGKMVIGLAPERAAKYLLNCKNSIAAEAAIIGKLEQNLPVWS